MTECEMFKRYEQVRSSGKYNMAIEAIDAMKEAGLNQNQYFTVLFNYTELKDKYGAKQATDSEVLDEVIKLIDEGECWA